MSSKRIADRIQVEVPMAPRGAPVIDIEDTRAEIRRAQLVDVDAVANMVFRGVKPGDNYDLGDYPNVAPPFESAWFEYRRPPYVASFDDIAADLRQRGLDPYALDNPPAGRIAIPERVGVLVTSRRNDDGSWSSALGFYLTTPDHFIGPVILALEVDPEGQGTGLSVVMAEGAPTSTWAAQFALVANLETPLLMATSLLHAKNVTLEPEEPLPPKLARAYQRRHGVQRVRFSQLHIEPMRKVIRRPDGEEPQTVGETKQALHLVRGHFKDYRDGRGLFGRQHGLWWWESQARGNIDEGAIEKEYVIERPGGRA